MVFLSKYPWESEPVPLYFQPFLFGGCIIRLADCTCFSSFIGSVDWDKSFCTGTRSSHYTLHSEPTYPASGHPTSVAGWRIRSVLLCHCQGNSRFGYRLPICFPLSRGWKRSWEWRNPVHSIVGVADCSLLGWSGTRDNPWSPRKDNRRFVALLLSDMGDVLRGDTSLEVSITHFIPSCHIREADGEIGFVGILKPQFLTLPLASSMSIPFLADRQWAQVMTARQLLIPDKCGCRIAALPKENDAGRMYGVRSSMRFNRQVTSSVW